MSAHLVLALAIVAAFIGGELCGLRARRADRPAQKRDQGCCPLCDGSGHMAPIDKAR